MRFWTLEFAGAEGRGGWLRGVGDMDVEVFGLKGFGEAL